jgi:hypothetical protein
MFQKHICSETQCVALSIFLMMEKVLVNAAEITHVQLLSKSICCTHTQHA